MKEKNKITYKNPHLNTEAQLHFMTQQSCQMPALICRNAVILAPIAIAWVGNAILQTLLLMGMQLFKNEQCFL